MRLTPEGVKTSSRGGGHYDIPAAHIINNPKIIEYLTSHPDFILDGELYVHGENLQTLSGMCRKEVRESKHNSLQYHIYDFANTDLIFEDRLKVLSEMREFFDGEEHINICEHVETNSWDEIENLHNKWVNDGYEGCVLRNPNQPYVFGKKDNRMIKVKMMEDDTYEIIGYELGLRGTEDMVFVLKTKEGKEFKAKPKGTREDREEYMFNIEDIIGRGGDVRHFGVTPDNIPNLPIFIAVRYDLDIY